MLKYNKMQLEVLKKPPTVKDCKQTTKFYKKQEKS